MTAVILGLYAAAMGAGWWLAGAIGFGLVIAGLVAFERWRLRILHRDPSLLYAHRSERDGRTRKSA